MRSVLDKTLDLAFGTWALTRDKVQEQIDDLVRRGEVAREESGGLVDDILRRGQKQREEMQAFAQREVGDAVNRINIATRDDVARLERRVQELEVLVNDLRGGGTPVAAGVASPVEVVPTDPLPPVESE